MAARHGAVRVSLERCARMPMAIEAKSVKPGLDSRAKISPPAAVALDAQRCACSIGIVVVAREAIDGAVLVMREIERQPGRAKKDRLAERRVDRRRQ